VVSKQASDLLKPQFFERCLEDSLSEVKKAGLAGIRKRLNKDWVAPLCRFINTTKKFDELAEALRLLGSTNNKAAIQPLVDFLNTAYDQTLRWACIQALDSIDQKVRLAYYQKQLLSGPSERHPLIIELLGHCEGREPYLILKKAMAQFEDSGMRGLLIGAMGTIEYPPCEADLVKLMENNVTEAYAAATALKNLIKGKVLAHFDNFLAKPHLDVLVKQIILQHISEVAQSMPIPTTTTTMVESFLMKENENLRYLAVIALGNIQAESSICALLNISSQEWVEKFRSELNSAIEKCCKGKITRLLHIMDNKEHNGMVQDILRFLSINPLSLCDEDLDILNTSFRNSEWHWDKDLIPCVERTYRKDKNFIWRQFRRKDLSEKLICFLARGVDEANPDTKDVLEPSILVKCFSRFQTEQPLLLLGKLMSRFASEELLPPLIQFAESADSDTQAIFKSYVHQMIVRMQTIDEY